MNPEIERIQNLANRLYANACMETRVEDKYQLLAAIVHSLDPKYFNVPVYSRQSTQQMLGPAMAPKVTNLYKFVADSDMRPLLKGRVCEEALFFLRDECKVGAEELEELRKIFDVVAYWNEFWTID